MSCIERGKKRYNLCLGLYDRRRERGSVLCILNACAWLLWKPTIFSFLAVMASAKKVKEGSHQCQPNGGKAETKARESGKRVTLGMWLWEGGREKEQSAKKSSAESVYLPRFGHISVSPSTGGKKSGFPYSWCIHILPVLGWWRHTFADTDRVSHRPYVALRADAKPASWGERSTLLNR